MEKETKLNNEQNTSPLAGGEANPIGVNPKSGEIKIAEEPKKLSLSDINPSDLTAKIEDFFRGKLETLESKFKNDLEIVEPFKFQFIDLYHNLENLKQEILDFLKIEEEKKTTQKKPAGPSAITRNNTSRSRTPIKFKATSKLASTRDVTKSANLKGGDLDKSRSRTPLTATKQTNEKSRKDVSISKTATKKTLNTSTLTLNTHNAASTLNTTREANTVKKQNTTAAAKAAAQKRDLTPVSSSKAGKALDTSSISHNEPIHTEQAKSSKAAKQNLNKDSKANVNVASATLKKPAAESLNAGNSAKKKAAAEQPPVSSFNSSVDLTSAAKKKSVLAGAAGNNVSGVDLKQGYSSNNNLLAGENLNVNNNNNHVGDVNENKGAVSARKSVNGGSGKGERKASLPAQRGSVSGNKRSSVELKKENVNGSVDEKRENNTEMKDEQNRVNADVKRKSIEVKKIEIDENKKNDNLIEVDDNIIVIEKNKNESAAEAEVSQNNNENYINNKAEEKLNNDTRKSISDMVFENQAVKQDEKEAIVSEDKLVSEVKNEIIIGNNNINSAKNIAEKRQSIKEEAQIKDAENANASEKAENDIKIAEERKKSVVVSAESINSNVSASAEDKKPEEFKAEVSIESKETVTEAAKSSGSVNNKKLLLSFSNRKSCALHLLIRSGLLTIKEQILAVYCNKELIGSHSAEIKEDLFIFLKDKVAEYEALVSKYKSDLSNLTIINKQLTFSKTAVNGLNFVKKDEENGLLKKEQNEKIVDVFKFFCILLNENYETLQSNKIIEFFMVTVLPKYKIESLKKFVSEYVPANIMSFDFNLEKLLDFVNKHHHILVSNELLSLNRSVSYVTFSNKEIFEFLSAKLSDGNYAYYNRKANGLIKKYNEILNKLGQ